jgi:two-component system response regulator DegU
MNKIRVLIADDHKMIREGLKQLIELEEDISVVDMASDGEEAIRLINEKKPDVVLMDINMPNKNGLQTIEELRNEKNQVKIIVLTIHQDREYLFKTVNLGVDGYILKDADPNILIEAIKSVNAGETYIQSNMLTELVKKFNSVTSNEKSKEEETGLTPREIEVLELIADGKGNKEIGKTLYISEKTVKNHVSSIFRKINVTDRTQAAIFAFKHDIHVK